MKTKQQIALEGVASELASFISPSRIAEAEAALSDYVAVIDMQATPVSAEFFSRLLMCLHIGALAEDHAGCVELLRLAVYAGFKAGVAFAESRELEKLAALGGEETT